MNITPGPLPRPAATVAPAEDKKVLLVLSVTVINPGTDLTLPTWNSVGEWLGTNAITGAFGLERGEAENNAHAQGVIK